MAIKSVVAVAAIAALLAAVASGWGAGAAQANGAARIIVQDRQAGPFLLRVGIVPGTPTVGLLHLSVLVQDAAGETAVTDAAVSVVAVGPEGSGGPVRMEAANSLQSPQLYEGNLSLDALGAWILTVDTESPLGQATLEVPIEVQESSPFNLMFVILGVAVALIAGVLLWSQLQRSRRRSTGGAG